MPLRLQYLDKYRLWADLIKADTQRFFIASDQPLRIGGQVSVEISIGTVPGSQALPVVIVGKVIGLRGVSNRFPSGAFIHFEDKEIEKCRRLVGLSQTFEPALCRTAIRVDCALPLRFLVPEDPGPFEAKNLSAEGLMATSPAGLFDSQRVKVALTLDDGQVVELHAEVSWTQESDKMAGFHLLDLSTDVARRLEGCLQRIEGLRKADEAARHRLIVVADDEPSILELLTRVLQKHNFQVAIAKRGDEALALIRKVKPKMVILDVLMPGLDGLDICKMLRADASMADIPVIFLSALDEETLTRVAGDAGATDFLHKPIALTDLLNMVGTYLK
ncbi:MAG: response regulator [Myxococcaceae bacterium]